MVHSLKVLAIVVVIIVSALTGLGLYSYLYHPTPTNSVASSVLTINSLNITPGLEQDPSVMMGPKAYSEYNFSYTIHMYVTITLNKTIKAVPTCLLAGMGIKSSSWYQFPVQYLCPLLSNTPITYKAGLYNYSMIGEVMSNTSIPKYPATLHVKVTSGVFNVSKTITLTLTSHGLKYINLYDIMIKPTTPLANGSISLIYNASFYFMSD